MAMHDPPHPGEFIVQIYLEPNHISGRELAAKLGVAASTLNRVLKGTSNLSPEMALRLSKALGRFAESWLERSESYAMHSVCCEPSISMASMGSKQMKSTM